MVPIPFHFLDRVLSDDTAIVFHFDFKLVVRQDALAKRENLGKPIRPEPMLEIASDVRLQQDRLTPARHSAAIDEALYHVPDFSDVGMRRNKIAIRQNKTRGGGWKLFESRTEIR